MSAKEVFRGMKTEGETGLGWSAENPGQLEATFSSHAFGHRWVGLLAGYCGSRSNRSGPWPLCAMSNDVSGASGSSYAQLSRK